MPAIAAVVVVLAAATTVVLLNRGDSTQAADEQHAVPTASTQPKGDGTGAPSPDALQLYDDGAVAPFIGMVGAATDHSLVELQPSGGKSSGITATPDANGLRVRWDGTVPSRFSLRTPNHQQDLSSYVDSKGALTFDIVVHEEPSKQVQLSMFCGPSCVATLSAKQLVSKLPAGQRSTVKVPLSCFIEHGLDPKHITAPYVLYADGQFDATLDNVRWQKGAAEDDDAISCSDLK